MKNLIGVILGLLIVSNVNAQQVQAELRDGLIDKDYDAFSILNSNSNIKPNTKEAMIFSDDYMAGIITYTGSSFPTVAVRNEIEDAIRHELIADGYNHQMSGSEMLVIYSIFSKKGEVIGDFANNDRASSETFDVGKGTLIISIIDRESGETVWSGFNDGALANVTSLEENKIVRSVTDILDLLRLERG